MLLFENTWGKKMQKKNHPAFCSIGWGTKKHFPFTDPDVNLCLDCLQIEHLNIESVGSFLSNVSSAPGSLAHVP